VKSLNYNLIYSRSYFVLPASRYITSVTLTTTGDGSLSF